MKNIWHNRGFTLLEITVSMTIFLVGILFIFSLFPQGLSVIHRDKKKIAMDMIFASLYRGIIHLCEEKGLAYVSLNFFDKKTIFSLHNPLVQEGLFILDPTTPITTLKEKTPLIVQYNAHLVSKQKTKYVVIDLKDEKESSYEYHYEKPL